MNGLEMTMDIRFNRELTEQDYVVPGGYEMVFDGRSISFDFQTYCGTINRKDPTVLHCEMRHPDYDSFEDFRSITVKDLECVSEIIECYIYIGEECTPALAVAEILAITFWPADVDPVDIHRNVIIKYNENRKDETK